MGSHRKGAGKHEDSCYEEHLKEDILDTGKLYRICKKAKKLDDDGVEFPLSVSYVEYFAPKRKMKKVKKVKKVSKKVKKILSELGVEPYEGTTLEKFFDNEEGQK